MPVMNTEIVKYDCNVSIQETPPPFTFTYRSTTIIVELPDGMEEKGPDALEWALFKGVLRRLEVVATEMPTSQSQWDPLSHYLIHISTDRGYFLGKISLTTPFSTGWHNRKINLSGQCTAHEIEWYIERGLHHHLAIGINQRMPPLPRPAAGPSGKGKDLVYSMPWPLDLVPDSILPDKPQAATGVMQTLAHLLQDVPSTAPEVGIDVSRMQEAVWTDVAAQVGSEARDVTEGARELDR